MAGLPMLNGRAVDFFQTAVAPGGRLDRSPGNKFQKKCGRASGPRKGLTMYAVIRTGGKQYLVSPGERLKIERTAHENGTIEFSDILAVSAEEGKFESSLDGAKVTATVLGEGRGEKILVFKLKRKK